MEGGALRRRQKHNSRGLAKRVEGAGPSCQTVWGATALIARESLPHWAAGRPCPRTHR
jgi:hypothetical protein